MPWIGPAIGAGIGLLGGGNSQGGTVSKDPWAPAAPWLTGQISRGQQLQGQYEQNPFNSIQQGAYGNLLAGNDYINQMTPGLLAQFTQQTGFDRSNPHARPQAYQLPQMQAMGAQGGMQPMQGLLSGSMQQATAQPAPVAAPAAAPFNPFDDQQRMAYMQAVRGGEGG